MSARRVVHRSSIVVIAPAGVKPVRWLALAVIVLAQFMVVLDVSIVNVALPAIRTDLGFSMEGLQWVITAYAIVSAVFCCSADAWGTCSAAAPCFSPGSGCSRARRCLPG